MTEAPMNEKLEPCPMCGMTDDDSGPTQESGLNVEYVKTAILVRGYQVRCCCGTSGKIALNRAEAIAAWNTRAMFDAAPDRTPAGEGGAVAYGYVRGVPVDASGIALTRPQASLTAEEVAELIVDRLGAGTVGLTHEASLNAALPIAAEILARLSPSDRSGS